MRKLETNKELPDTTFFDNFYIWFDIFNREELYATPLYFYKADFHMILDEKYRDVYWKESEGTDGGLKHPATIYLPFKEKLGMFLLRFLNADLTTYNTAYKDFFYAYGFEILRDLIKDKKFRFSDNYGSDENFLKETMKVYFEVKDQLVKIQKELIKAVTYIYNLDEIEELKPYNCLERYTVYIVKHLGKLHTYNKNDEILENTSKDKYKEFSEYTESTMLGRLSTNPVVVTMKRVHKSNDIASICYAILEEIVQIPNLPIKKCQNCGMYFIPYSRPNIIYCNYPKENGKTCEEIGPLKTFKKQLEDNKAYGEYKRIYHTKFQQVSRNKGNEELKANFEEWKIEAKDTINKNKRGELTEEQALKWFTENQ